MDPIIYENNRKSMAKTSLYLGIGALASSVLLMSFPYLSVGLACFSILMALLSRGSKVTFDKEARIGFACAIPSIFISVGILVTVVVALYTNTGYRQNVGELMDNLYGNEFEATYNQSASDMLNQLLGTSDPE